MSASTLPPPEITFADASPVLTHAEMQDRGRLWEAEGLIHSGVTAVGTIALAPEHEAILQTMTAEDTRPYGEIFVLDLGTTEGLTEPQRELCQVLWNATREVVMWDAARMGVRARSIQASAGWYNGPRNGTGPHPDGLAPRWPYRSIVRWVVSFGLASTRFFEGEVRKDMFTRPNRDGQRFRDPNAKELTPVDYPPGTVLRFMTHFDIHEGRRDVTGSRVFFSGVGERSREY